MYQYQYVCIYMYMSYNWNHLTQILSSSNLIFNQLKSSVK